MLKRSISSIAVILVIVLFLSGYTAGKAGMIMGRVTHLSGKARVKESGQKEWKALKKGMHIHAAERIETARQSRCEISFRGKSVARMDERTIIDVRHDIEGGDKLKVDSGDIWLAHLLPETKSAIEIETPSSACSIRGTVYRLSCNNNETTYRCYKGVIKVDPLSQERRSGPDDSFLIHGGEELILVQNYSEYLKKQKKEFNDFISDKMGAFEQYNQDQMKSFSESVSSDMKDFKKMNGYYVKYNKFDEEKDREDDWVKWNLKRDQALAERLSETDEPTDAPEE